MSREDDDRALIKLLHVVEIIQKEVTYDMSTIAEETDWRSIALRIDLKFNARVKERRKWVEEMTEEFISGLDRIEDTVRSTSTHKPQNDLYSLYKNQEKISNELKQRNKELMREIDTLKAMLIQAK